MRDNKWVPLLAYVTGLVNERLLLQNEYLIAENRILRSHLPTRLRLSETERSTLAEIGNRLGRKDLMLVASVALPDTILAWYRRLIAQKFDGSKRRPIRAVPRLRLKSKPSSSGWPARTRPGDTTASSAHSPTRATVFRTKPSATSATLRHSTSAETQPEDHLEGVHLRAHGYADRRRTSSPTKCSRGGVWPPTTYCSSSNWRRAGSLLPASRATRRPTGYCRWPGMQSMKKRAISAANGICCTTAIRNSAPRFGTC